MWVIGAGATFFFLVMVHPARDCSSGKCETSVAALVIYIIASMIVGSIIEWAWEKSKGGSSD